MAHQRGAQVRVRAHRGERIELDAPPRAKQGFDVAVFGWAQPGLAERVVPRLGSREGYLHRPIWFSKLIGSKSEHTSTQILAGGGANSLRLQGTMQLPW